MSVGASQEMWEVRERCRADDIPAVIAVADFFRLPFFFDVRYEMYMLTRA